MLGDLFYHLGTVVGGLSAPLSGKAGAGDHPTEGDVAFYDPETGDITELEHGAAIGHAGTVVAGAAAAWIAARGLRPRAVSWPRVVVAGVAATFLADLASLAFPAADEHPSRALDDDAEDMARRYGAGIARAAGYAAVLYPRLPGSPLMRGLAFGAMEVAATPHGGLVGLAARAPGLRFPLQSLAGMDEIARDPVAQLAFGLGLGLFYRTGHGEPDD